MGVQCSTAEFQKQATVSICLQKKRLNYNESIEECYRIIEEVHMDTKIGPVKYKNQFTKPVRLFLFSFKRMHENFTFGFLFFMLF